MKSLILAVLALTLIACGGKEEVTNKHQDTATTFIDGANLDYCPAELTVTQILMDGDGNDYIVTYCDCSLITDGPQFCASMF